VGGGWCGVGGWGGEGVGGGGWGEGVGEFALTPHVHMYPRQSPNWWGSLEVK
jgi:hypothetical protein